MSSAAIIRIPILPLGIVNAYLIKSEDDCIVVDSCIPGSERRIAKVLAAHLLSFRDIKLIVVTHPHTDHTGSAARLRALSVAPILAHGDDADFYSRAEPMTYCPTSLVGRLFLKTPAPHQLCLRCPGAAGSHVGRHRRHRRPAFSAHGLFAGQARVLPYGIRNDGHRHRRGVPAGPLRSALIGSCAAVILWATCWARAALTRRTAAHLWPSRRSDYGRPA
jgi:hypothetical protein